MKSTEWVKGLALAAMCTVPVTAVAEPRNVDAAPMALTLPLSPAQEAVLKQRAKLEATGQGQRRATRPQPRRLAQAAQRPLREYGYQMPQQQAAPAQPMPYGLQGYAIVGQQQVVRR